MDAPVLFYKGKKDLIQCELCSHLCILSEGKWGRCKVRTVHDGQLIATNFGKVTSAAFDPIEKKPLYHFMPGTCILSIGSFGCNMTCSFCQNYEISQHQPHSKTLPVEQLCQILSEQPNHVGVAFTYNEPFMWYEYVYEAAKKIKQTMPHQKIVMVTNGYINQSPLMKLLPYIDAMNIDLKGYTNQYYRKICGAKLNPVLETIKLVANKVHLEITTLLVSDENDSLEEVEEIAKFIASINPNIPFHLSRYFPKYKLNHQATKIEVLIKAKAIARNYLNYVYIGNVANLNQNTYCPDCQELLIERNLYESKVFLTEPKCPTCGAKIEMILT
ncbi:AmmeMemoRadiSam system radical SAM enzyme [Turicibacter sanguinis]|uniref:AmmeMemoRadiSam system radical SAM enzyme n=1 Tax=Turicibacter sanguinis TaxID=154288 RepID=UPI0012BC0736|nr:AmmeMemoRadiSam system radical SAM enzyme [Turicibacter sanguinis]MCU7197021.1 AmmeMemoRadiSam system radical SAM enzyme [Turicibacter sanguinis]MTO10456.1 AmmeMemoRadiSam system radical SAM enzyme [Turicibacter sanguinis]MTP47990.1 AmmeMemoRadiSam system radical SAM enzyme [Turicibacter sanguinis]MTP50738.1 AmmeMemoRadiSam system radical SAM enzyme [Turicibacter sanguinis]MTQ07974.1 AmmeMemoRadiSam system radical SAM enzyme [Turicibacter sanguinis]